MRGPARLPKTLRSASSTFHPRSNSMSCSLAIEKAVCTMSIKKKSHYQITHAFSSCIEFLVESSVTRGADIDVKLPYRLTWQGQVAQDDSHLHTKGAPKLLLLLLIWHGTLSQQVHFSSKDLVRQPHALRSQGNCELLTQHALCPVTPAPALEAPHPKTTRRG